MTTTLPNDAQLIARYYPREACLGVILRRLTNAQILAEELIEIGEPHSRGRLAELWFRRFGLPWGPLVLAINDLEAGCLDEAFGYGTDDKPSLGQSGLLPERGFGVV